MIEDLKSAFNSSNTKYPTYNGYNGFNSGLGCEIFFLSISQISRVSNKSYT